MKKVLNKIALIFILITIFLIIMTVKANAASLSIITSKSSVAPGESFTVTVTLNNGAGSVTSDGQTQWLDNSSFSYTKTAGSSGSVSLSASGTVADYTTEEDQDVYASATVSIVSPNSSGSSSKTVEKPKEVEKSKINTLKALSIEGLELVPEFDIDEREYEVKVPYEVTAINVIAEPKDSKASVKIEGNEDLQVGENTVTITVTAENGNESKYLIRVIRAREALYLKTIIVKYINQEGETVELPLNPAFDINVLEYTLEDIEFLVENLIIESEANLPEAIIEIQGNENLQVGDNTITIVARIASEEVVEEGQEPKEEIITYTIKVNKLPEPTFLEKFKNTFKAIFGGIITWYNNNQQKVVVYSLIACIIALIALSIYIVVDYKKYKSLLEKLKKVGQINTIEPTAEFNSESNIENEMEIESDEIESIDDTTNEEKNVKTKGGKHF